jgi:hypothetical protein
MVQFLIMKPVRGAVVRAPGLFLLFVHGAVASSIYSVGVISIPGNAIAIQMSGINDSGQVAGFCECSSGYQAYIYTTSGYTAIPLPPGWTAASGYAINNSGQVAGYGYNGTTTQAFIGTASAITGVPFISGWSESEAYSINERGQIAGDGYNGTFQAFIGTTAGSTAIPLTAGFSTSYGTAINDSGQVVGTGSNGTFIGTTGGMTAVPLHNPQAINDSGQVAGNGSNGTTMQAYIGTALGSTLIPLPFGATYSNIYYGSLNHFGEVVGFSDAGGWIWSTTTGTALLNSLVPAGWDITDAISISNNGLILAEGSFNGGANEYVELFGHRARTKR